MRLRIKSATEYAYQQAPRRSTQYLRVTPRTSTGQTVEDWRVSAPGRLAPWTDVFGNLCHSLTLEEPAETLRISVDGVVETNDTAGVAPHLEGTLPVAQYLRPTAYTKVDPAIREFAEAWRTERESDPLAALHGMMASIHKHVVYETGTTDVMTTASEAFSQGRGVCQDHAHVLIAACRCLDVPARYVSGYLWTGADDETYSASHAWAECWVENLGWVSFDPANGVSATEHYVHVAAGFDYLHASPIQGVRIGGGAESMDVEVRLRRVEAPPAAAAAGSQVQQ